MANERVKEIIQNGGRAIALIADVIKKDKLIAAVDLLLREYGIIDGLLNAERGIMPGAVVAPDKDIFQSEITALKQAMDLNLFGKVLPTQIFGAAIAKQKKGSIVNISSMASQRVITKVLGYSMAKSAIDCYTKWFAVELCKRYSTATVSRVCCTDAGN